MPSSIIDPTITTVIPNKKPFTPQLLYTGINAHPHNAHTVSVSSRKRSSARLTLLRTSVDNVAALNKKYFPQQEAAARETAKIVKAQSEQQQNAKEDTIGQAQSIRTLLEMQYFFSDFVDGGLYISQSNEQLKLKLQRPHNNNTEENPFLYVAETLNRVFDNPNSLLDAPELQFSHQLVGTEDAYFDKHLCRLWLEKIQILLVDLLHPLHVLPHIAQISMVRFAWFKLRGNPLQRALNLARIGRLWFIVGEHQIRIAHLAMKRVFSKWKPIWVRGKEIILMFERRRRNRMLRMCWVDWQTYVLSRLWDSVNETKVDIGWRKLRNVMEIKRISKAWKIWKAYDRHKQRLLIAQRSIVLIKQIYDAWKVFVSARRQSRQDKAISLLTKCNHRPSTHRDHIADFFRKGWVLQQRCRQWKIWVTKQRRLRNMVVSALKRMASSYLGLAFMLWKRYATKVTTEEIKTTAKRHGRQKNISHCHMCSHVPCPPSCSYAIELKIARSQWRHIEL